MEFIEKKKAINKAEKLCMQSEKCIFDMKQKFFSWKVNPVDYDEIIESLIENKFIDETRYTEYFVKDKLNLNKWGKTKIKYALLQKHINEKIISEELEKINDSDYKILIRNELKKKINSLQTLDFNTLKNKLLQFGTSRGYELEYLFPIIEEFKN